VIPGSKLLITQFQFHSNFQIKIIQSVKLWIILGISTWKGQATLSIEIETDSMNL